MRVFDYLSLSIRSLRLYSLRSLLAILGVVIGTAAVLDVVSVAEGARAEVSKQISSLGSHLLLVVPGAQPDQGVRQQAGSMLTLTAADARALAQEIPGVVFAAPFIDAQMTAVSGNLNWSTLIAGITPDYFQARGWALAEGEWLNVEIRDNGAGLTRGHVRPDGIGLTTTRARLERLYNDQQELTLANLPEGGCVARIRIPFQLTSEDRGEPLVRPPLPATSDAPLAAAGD